MRYATFETSGETRIGVLDGDEVIDLAAAVPGAPRDLVTALASPADLAAAARAALASALPRIPLSAAVFAPLLPRPGKIVCLGLNYYDHAKEGGREKPDYPWFFFRCATSLVAHGRPGRVPRVSTRFDYEAELAVVIGSRVPRHTRRDDALRHVFGYACFNDMSVRDYQKRTPQWTIGKNFDATGGFGPILVSADELPAGAAGLRIQGRLNGNVVQDANTSDMIFDVAETLELLADVLTLEPGDVIVMGTPAGVGQARTPPVWMKAGDRFEVEIERIGTLVNPIENEAG